MRGTDGADQELKSRIRQAKVSCRGIPGVVAMTVMSTAISGVTLFGYTLPTAIELAITCSFAVVLRTLAVSGFGKPE